MPEINPVTKDQLFEKKIAENIGSDYNVGDISDVVPVTKDQALLKEIALNTAELDNKVSANAEAIEAIADVYVGKNLLKYPYVDSTNTQGGLTFTDNGDGTVNVSGSETTGSNVYFALENNISVTLGTKVSDIFPTAGKYTISCENADGTNIFMSVYIADVGSYDHISADGTDIDITNAMMSKTLRIHLEIKHDYVLSSTITLKPMIRDARITDPSYVPYAMTNRELTERVDRGSVSVTADGVKDTGALFDELMALVDKYKLSSTSYIIFGNDCYRWQYTGSSLNIPFTQAYVEIDKLYVNTLRYTTGGSAWYGYSSTDGVQNKTNVVLPSGYPITLYY